MKGGTGIFIDSKNQKKDFIDFLNHSSISFLSSGAYGLVFKATLDPQSGYVSNYKMLDYKNFGKPSDTLVIKLSVLGYKSGSKKSRYYPDVITEESFIREVNIQTNVFLKTMQYLQPLCPAIVYSNIHNNNETIITDSIIDIIIDKIKSDHYKDILRGIKNDMTGYAIIGMEMLKEYDVLEEIIEYIDDSGDDDYLPEDLYKSMIAYILIELAIKTGYSHADFHKGNIMINTNENTYFKGTKASIILIDFGLAVKITPDIMNKIKEEYKNKNYTKIINILCENVRRHDGFKLTRNTMYQYICGDDGIKLSNSKIGDLFIQREEAIDDIIKISATNPLIPKLPLGNYIKNKMFPGMIETRILFGGKQKTVKRRNRKTRNVHRKSNSSKK